MEEQAVAVRENSGFGLMDYAGALEQASGNIKAIRRYVEDNFVEGIDFGPPFPGGDKPTLLLPGAQKFNLLFNARPEYEVLNKVEDYDKGFCLYHFRCRLINRASTMILGEGEGTCNSYESKYRWRQSERVCPDCGKPTILKSKDGKGWFCWRKKGGCGMNFSISDKRITDQEVGRVQNQDLFDIWNTVLKMAMKRAMVSAAHSTGGVGDLFTQDAEDFVDGSTGEIVESRPVRRELARKSEEHIPVEPEAFPVLSPDDGGNFVKKHEKLQVKGESVVFNGKAILANDTVSQKVSAWFRQHFVGAFEYRGSLEDGGRFHPSHLTQHLKAHFSKAKLEDMTNREFVSLVEYVWFKTGNPRGKIDPIYYPDKVDETQSAQERVEELVPLSGAELAALVTEKAEGLPGKVDIYNLAGEVYGEADFSKLNDDQLANLSHLIDLVERGKVKAEFEAMKTELEM